MSEIIKLNNNFSYYILILRIVIIFEKNKIAQETKWIIIRKISIKTIRRQTTTNTKTGTKTRSTTTLSFNRRCPKSREPEFQCAIIAVFVDECDFRFSPCQLLKKCCQVVNYFKYY